MVGWIMADSEYAKRVHSLLVQWSYGKLKDEENNIRASMIVDGKDEYVFFVIQTWIENCCKILRRCRKGKKEASLTDVHHKQMAMLIFGKRCQITANSYFPTFRKRYQDGVPYLFRLVVLGDDGQPHEIAGLEDFILFNLKIKDRDELDRKDIEYDLLRILG